MMRNAHTVAKTGRKIKKSTNKILPSFPRASCKVFRTAHDSGGLAGLHASGTRSEIVTTQYLSSWPARFAVRLPIFESNISLHQGDSGSHWLHRHIVHQELGARYDHAVACAQP